MSDTITQECKCCETDGDCINGLCMSCANFVHNLEKHYDKMKEQRDELLEACKRNKKQVVEDYGNTVWDANYDYMEAAIAEAEKGSE